MGKQGPVKRKPQAILFDLDGTLLRVAMAEFIPRYVNGLAACCAGHVKPAKFARAMLEAISALIRVDGDGKRTNEQRIISSLQRQLAVPSEVLNEVFSLFRQDGLGNLEDLVKPIPLARTIVAECLEHGVPLVLATNPVFPAYMIQARLLWGGLDDLDFVHLTSFENSCYCKPQPGYFHEITRLLGISPEDCVMVGNDTGHDLSAAAVGMPTYLVDTWIVERDEAFWPCENRGDHGALQAFLRKCLA